MCGPLVCALTALLVCAAADARTARHRHGPADDAPRSDAGRTPVTDAQAAASAAATEERRLATERVESATRLRAAEEEVADRAEETQALATKREEAATRLAARAAAMAPLLPLMQRLALFPAETLLAVPAPPAEALRGLGVMRGIARGLEQEAAALRRDQAALEADTVALQQSLPRLQAARDAQAEQDRVLDRQLSIARETRLRADDASRRAEADAARAETLRAAMAALEASRARAEAQARADEARADRQRQEGAAQDARRRQEVMAPPPGPAPEPRGQLLAPVAGGVTRGWGEVTEAGPAAGISYRPAPQARVTAPCGGRVRFAAPFRSYGVLVILDCGGGYSFVLAGLARLDVAAGGAVLPGEPLGAMPDWNPATPGPHPALYLELRRDGQAVNPTPFLRGGGPLKRG